MLNESSLKIHPQAGTQAMKIIFDLAKTMAKQGLAFGHEESDGNFQQLLQNQVRAISSSSS